MCKICAQNIITDPIAAHSYKRLAKGSMDMRDGIWDGTLKPSDLHLPSVQQMHRDILKEIKDELAWGDLSNLKPGSPRHTRLAALELNSFTFSALKNYDFLNNMNQIRLKPGMTQAEFNKEWEAAHNMVYNLHSKVEKEHARSVATAIRTWENVEKYSETMPFLTYQTAGDERVREKHALLDGITKRWDDRLWETHYPPNGYRCRCHATQDFEGEESDLTPERMANLPAPDSGFDINWGKGDVAFRRRHPYMNIDFKDHAVVNDRISSLLSSQLKGYFKASDKLMIHPLHNTGELAKNIAAAGKYGNKQIKLNPDIGLEGFKNPDTYSNLLRTDFKTQEGASLKSFLNNHIRAASEQRIENLVLIVNDLDYRALKGVLNNKYRNDSVIQSITLIKDKTKLVLKRDKWREQLDKALKPKSP
jgi:SPP1 gp7 family putative phage head morphogenesis protein